MQIKGVFSFGLGMISDKMCSSVGSPVVISRKTDFQLKFSNAACMSRRIESCFLVLNATISRFTFFASSNITFFAIASDCITDDARELWLFRTICLMWCFLDGVPIL